MMKILFSIILAVSVVTLNFAQISFIPNEGQIADEFGNVREDIRFVANYGSVKIAFTPTGYLYYFTKVEDVPVDLLTDAQRELLRKGNTVQEKKVSNFCLSVDFVGSNLQVSMIGEKEKTSQRKYYYGFLGEAPAQVKEYEEVIYKDIYPNIDVRFYSKNGRFKYEFILHPGANPEQIQLQYNGFNAIEKQKNGSLKLYSVPGILEESEPIAFLNNGERIHTEYVTTGNQVTFKVDNYDYAETLIIDPFVMWSTFFYDSYSNESWTNPVFDADNNMYLCSYTYNEFFPTLNPGGNWFSSTFDQGFPDITQLTITKFSHEGELIWSTFYGGDAGDYLNIDYGKGMALQGNNLYIVGRTSSGDFPMLDAGNGAYYEVNDGNERAFILNFDLEGNRLWATKFVNNGVSSNANGTRLNGIDTDDDGNLYMVGSTYSSSNLDIPLVNGGTGYYNSTFTGQQNAFVGKFNANRALVWCTYLNNDNSYYDQGSDVTITPNNDIFLVGRTTMEVNAPTINGVDPGNGAYYQNTHASLGGGGGTPDVFFAKFSSDYDLEWYTLYGGNDMDISSQLENDPLGNIYCVFRIIQSDNLPLFDPGLGAYYNGTKTSPTDVSEGAIISFTDNGNLRWGTYIPSGAEGMRTFGLGVGDNQHVYISGTVFNNDFTALENPDYYNQNNSGGLNDRVVLKFDQDFNLDWATYFGGSEDEDGYRHAGLASSPCGETVFAFTGMTKSDDFPFADLGGPAWYQDTIGGTASFVSTIVSLRFPGSNASAAGVMVDTLVCTSDSYVVNASSGNTYMWSTGDTVSTIVLTESDTVWVDISSNGCTRRDSFFIRIDYVDVSISGPDTVCEGSNATFVASGNNIETYTWNLGSSTSEQNLIATSNISALSVTVSSAEGCKDSSAVVPPFQALLSKPVAGFGYVILDSINNQFLFLDSSSNDVSHWYWDFGEGLGIDTSNPIHTFLDMGVYTVRQIVTNDFGCSASAEVTIEVDGELLIPNVFSPNGDGLNDVFKIKNIGGMAYKLIVYDRWGLKLFDSDEGTSWDGTTFSGKEVPEGTYYFTLEILGGEAREVLGHITLLRD